MQGKLYKYNTTHPQFDLIFKFPTCQNLNKTIRDHNHKKCWYLAM